MTRRRIDYEQGGSSESLYESVISKVSNSVTDTNFIPPHTLIPLLQLISGWNNPVVHFAGRYDRIPRP